MVKSSKGRKSLGEPDKRSLGSLVNDVARQSKIAFDRQAIGLGLTRAQWQLLLHLHRCDGMTQTELAAVLELSVPTVSNLVHRLAAHGWIEITINPEHRLNKYLHLCPKARPALREVRTLARKVDAQATHGLDAEDVALLIKLLSQIKQNLCAVRQSGRLPHPARVTHRGSATAAAELRKPKSAKRAIAPR